MIKRISVKELKLGMFVQELHGSWIKHPFWKTRFLLENPEDLALLKSCGIDEVSIDESRGSGTKPESEIRSAAMWTQSPASEASPTTVGAARMPAVKTEKISFHQEFRRARELCNSAKGAVIDMFSEARMGRTVSMETANRVVEQITASVERHPQALITLARLKTADDYTYVWLLLWNRKKTIC
jgi:hypothetical protein